MAPIAALPAIGATLALQQTLNIVDWPVASATPTRACGNDCLTRKRVVALSFCLEEGLVHIVTYRKDVHLLVADEHDRDPVIQIADHP